MDKISFLKILKYLFIALVIYSLLKYLPVYFTKDRLTDINLCIIVFIVVLIYISFDHFFQLNTCNISPDCSQICNKENMTNVHLSDIINSTSNQNIPSLEDDISEINNYLDEIKPMVNEINEINENNNNLPQMIQPVNINSSPINLFPTLSTSVSTTPLPTITTSTSTSTPTLTSSMINTITSSPTTQPVIIQKAEIIEKNNNNDINEIKTLLTTVINKLNSSPDRYNNGVLYNEMEYSDYNHLPLGDSSINSGTFDYGYAFLPPEQWYPKQLRPPVCVTNQKHEVSPIYTIGTPIDVKEWNESRRVSPPDNINVKYINEKLNSGR